MSEQLQVSVLIPAKNESANIVSLLREIRQALAGRFSYEVLVVDDGSTDNMRALMVAMQRDEHFPELRILTHAKSLGQSTSVYHAAQQARGTWLATLDGDGQNDPADIPGMLQHVIGTEQDPRGIKLVAGHRVNRRDTWVKRWSSRFANRLRARILRDDTPDTGCGLKVISREVFLELPYFDHLHRFIPALVQRHGYRKLIAPVNHRPRLGGQSNYGTLDRALVGILDLFGVWWLLRRTRLEVPAVELKPAGEQH